MNYIVFVLTVIACIFTAIVTVNKRLADKIGILNFTKTEKEFHSKQLTRRAKVLIVVLASALSIAAAFLLTQDISELINQIKMSIALVCLVGVGINDYREHRIPNIFPLIMGLTGVICLALGFAVMRDSAMSYVVSSVTAAIGAAVCMVLASIITRQGIGMGDIKVLCALSLIGGVYTICSTLFWGMLGCACGAVFFLFTKKKKIHESVPFGPFIFMGYILSVMLSIY